MELNNKVYDVLKILVMRVFPALALLMKTLGTIWSWQGAEMVVLSILALNTCVAEVIGVSSTNYYKNQIVDYNVGEEAGE